MDEKELSPEEKIDEIYLILKKQERRERRRRIVSIIKWILILLPFILIAFSSWYLATHWKELLQMFALMVSDSVTGGVQGALDGDSIRGYFEGLLGG